MADEYVDKELCEERYGNFKAALEALKSGQAEIKNMLNPRLPTLEQKVANHITQDKEREKSRSAQDKHSWFKAYVVINGIITLVLIGTLIAMVVR